MSYLLQRADGAYVSDPHRNGTGRSYTRDLMRAKVYPTREAAERDRCPGNETLVSTDDVFRRFR
jgi:hypothetical protein